MTQNLSEQLEKYLPPPVLALVGDAGKQAIERGQELYLVGGTVRDLFLGRANLDLDLVVEGDAIELARQLASLGPAKLTIHSRFGTAKLKYPDFSLDIATARSETYSRPGALPTVKPGNIKDDLIRRDFSINAMAARLNPQYFGELIDPFQGKDDINNRLIRILHSNSFIDDATRMLRAMRYEQRLGFKLETDTERLLRHDVAMLDTISGDRIRREMELILKEDYPELVLKRAEDMGVLARLHRSLKGDGWLSQKFDQARKLHKGAAVTPLYLCLLVYNFTARENEEFLSRLNFPKTIVETMRQTLQLKAELQRLSDSELKPSDVYEYLAGYRLQAIQANLLATPSPMVRERLHSYLSKLRLTRPLLDGEDLKRMGVPAGPRIGEMLNALRRARLNGAVRTRKQEEALVRRFL